MDRLQLKVGDQVKISNGLSLLVNHTQEGKAFLSPVNTDIPEQFRYSEDSGKLHRWRPDGWWLVHAEFHKVTAEEIWQDRLN